MAKESAADRLYKLMLIGSSRYWTLGDIGWTLWGETTECAHRGTGSHNSNKFHRSAGKVVKELQRRGLVKETNEHETCATFRAVYPSIQG